MQAVADAAQSEQRVPGRVGIRGRSLGAMLGVLLLAVTVVWPVSATLTSINVTGLPVVVGDTVSYRALDDNLNPWPVNYTWQYRCAEAGAQGVWQPVPFNTAAWSAQEVNIGNHEVRVTSEMTDSTTRQLETAVTVLGPTTDEVNSAQLGVETYFFMGPNPINLQFPVMHGNRKIGPYPDGHAEYRIRRPTIGQDTGWSTDAGYSLQGDTIVDQVAIEPVDFTENGFDGLAIGATVDDYYFQNRLVLKNCAGADVVFTFPERRFRKVKMGPNSWKLVEGGP